MSYQPGQGRVRSSKPHFIKYNFVLYRIRLVEHRSEHPARDNIYTYVYEGYEIRLMNTKAGKGALVFRSLQQKSLI